MTWRHIGHTLMNTCNETVLFAYNMGTFHLSVLPSEFPPSPIWQSEACLMSHNHPRDWFNIRSTVSHFLSLCFSLRCSQADKVLTRTKTF